RWWRAARVNATARYKRNVGRNSRLTTHPLHTQRIRLDERTRLELLVGDSKLFLRVHHDRAVPRDRLVDRLARHQQKSHRLVSGGHGDKITVGEPHEVHV